MKKNTQKTLKFICLSMAFAVTSFSYGQDQNQSKVLINTADSATVIPERTLEYWDSFIEALETKRTYVMSDQSMREKAEKNGWFKHIDAELLNARTEREKLLKKKD